ncbi:SCO7613 C-terminal domain-containing membrane protein [Streptomyces sp. NPDC002990]
MNTTLPPAEELALIDRELAQLDSRRLYLLSRRDWLLRALHQPGALAAGRAAAGVPPRPVKDASAPSAQNVLLVLGAVLLAVAALAFTLVSWGSLGIAGRSVVLAVVTAAALAAPAALLRRGLRSTAESVAAVGLLLTVLDAYALRVTGMPDADGLGYVAGAAAVLAVVWAGYGLGLPKLALPVPAAVLAAQLPLPLAALAAQAGPLDLGWALLATAALDAALALRVRMAAVPGALLGAGALLTGVAEVWAAASAARALAPAALLLAGAALGVAVARREPRASAAALAGGLAWVTALGGVARPALTGPTAQPSWAESGWVLVVHLLLALPLLAAVRAAAFPAAVRRGLARAGAVVAVLAAVAACSAAAPALLGRVRVLAEVWAATTPLPDADGPGAAAVVILLITAGAAHWLGRGLSRPEPGVVAVVLAWSGLFTAPLLLGLPVAAVFAAQLAVTAAAGALALRSAAGGAAIAAAVCALLGAANVSVAALDGRAATFLVWGLLGVGCAVTAAYRGALHWARSGAAVGAVGYATGVLVAAGAAAQWPVVWWALPVLAVPAAVAAAGPRLGGVRVPAEGAAAAAVVLAVALACRDALVLALVLSLAGVVCAGAAVRADRRVLGWAAGALFVAASWVRLASAGVAEPEAYTLPVTVPALAVGLLRRRRDERASSWTAYGPGLAATLLPSLLAAWGDAHWLRPLLLGLAALGVTLAGANRRLRAPLLLGGAVLAAVALHELAPYVVQVAGALPRWLPPALAGLLLLAVGATYEKRLRDARRLRDALGRLR